VYNLAEGGGVGQSEVDKGLRGRFPILPLYGCVNRRRSISTLLCLSSPTRILGKLASFRRPSTVERRLAYPNLGGNSENSPPFLGGLAHRLPIS